MAAVPADRSGVPVLASQVTVTLPADPASGLPVPVQDLRATTFGAPAKAQSTGGQVVFEANQDIPDGTALQVQVGFPHGLVAAEPQAVADRRGQRRPGLSLQDVGHRFHHQRRRPGDSGGTPTNCGGGGALRQGLHTIKHTGMDDVVDVAVLGRRPAFTSARSSAILLLGQPDTSHVRLGKLRCSL